MSTAVRTQAAPAAKRTREDVPGNQLARWLAVALVLTMALHSWPIAKYPALRFFWPANLVVLFWAGCVGLRSLRQQGRQALVAYLPPACIWAYMVIGMLSTAAAENLPRAGISAGKTALCVTGTYMLIAAACRSNVPNVIPWALVLTTSGVALHLTLQTVCNVVPVALFESPLKLGTYMAMMVPMTAAWLLLRGKPWMRVWAILLIVVGLSTCGSFFAWMGMLVGLVTVGFALRPMRGWLFIMLMAAIAVANVPVLASGKVALVKDIQWRENSGQDVRQRYIEWQALINLLKDRSGTGTGVGCLNDHRSEYYLRLPKNNTLAAFDQNGYLAAAAETGVPGLIVLCWIFIDYLRKGWRRRKQPLILAAWAGLCAASVAQMASSLTYNGILVAFVLVLALIDHGGRLQITQSLESTE